MKPKNRIYCPQCNRLKLQFETRAKAENFIRYNAEEIKEEGGYAPIRAYYCSACCVFLKNTQRLSKKDAAHFEPLGSDPNGS